MNPERPRPEHVEATEEKKERKSSALGRAAEVAMRLMTRKFQVEGKENAPEREGLIVANHSSHVDGWALAAAFKDSELSIIAKDVPGKPKLVQALERMMSVIGMREIASHLDPEDRKALEGTDSILGQVISREYNTEDRKEDIRHNLKALRLTARHLAEGKKVIYFPEGGFYEEGDKRLRNATQGALAMARLYKKETGRDLDIVPAAIEGGDSVLGSSPKGFSVGELAKAIKDKPGEVTIRVGEAFHVQDGDDFNALFQEKVGGMLPEDYKRKG